MGSQLRHQFARVDGEITAVESDRLTSAHRQHMQDPINAKNHPQSKLRTSLAHCSPPSRVLHFKESKNIVLSSNDHDINDCKSSSVLKNSNPQPTKCFVCSKPERTAFSQPTKRCILCHRRYHLDCDQLSVQIEPHILQSQWKCSRCLRKKSQSLSDRTNARSSVLSDSVPSTPSSKPDTRCPSVTESLSGNNSDKYEMAPIDERPTWMAELKYGSRIVPGCDRCRKEKKDCVKTTTWCQACRDAHRHCTWEDAPLHKTERGDRSDDIRSGADIKVCNAESSKGVNESSLRYSGCARPIKRQRMNERSTGSSKEADIEARNDEFSTDVNGSSSLYSDSARPVKHRRINDGPVINLDTSDEFKSLTSTTAVHNGSLPIRGTTATRRTRHPSDSTSLNMEASWLTTNTIGNQKPPYPSVKVAATSHGMTENFTESAVNEPGPVPKEASHTNPPDLFENMERFGPPSIFPVSPVVLPNTGSSTQTSQKIEWSGTFNLQERGLSPPYSPPLQIGILPPETPKDVCLETDLRKKHQGEELYPSALNLNTNAYDQRNGGNSETLALNNRSKDKVLMECSRCGKKILGGRGERGYLTCQSCKKFIEAPVIPESPKASDRSIDPNATRAEEFPHPTVMTHDDYKSTIEEQRRSLKAAAKDIAHLKEQNKRLTQRLGVITHHKAVFPPGSFHGHFLDVAPELRPFDPRAKKAEISKRPSRKETFDKRLANVRSERGPHLHREINRDFNISCQQDESCYNARNNNLEDPSGLEVPSLSKRSLLKPSQLQWAKITGVPANPIPVLGNDKTLAYRDGTRDSKGRLPRAKVLHKVGRDVAGQLK